MIKIENYQPKDSTALLDLFRSCRPAILWNYPKINKESIVDVFKEELRAQGICLLARKKNKLVGAICLKKKTWDSDYFGLPMAEISYFFCKKFCQKKAAGLLLARAIELANEDRIAHLSVKIDSKRRIFFNLFKRAGFRAIMEEVVHVLDKANISRIQGRLDLEVRPLRPGDLDKLMDLAGELAEVLPNRFQLDNTLAKEKGRNYYRECVKNSCNRLYSDGAFVAVKNKSLVGFHAHKCIGAGAKKKMGVSVLLAFIRASQRNKGAGFYFLGNLYNRLLRHSEFITGGVNKKNKRMLAFLEKKMGARTIGSQYIFHKRLTRI